MTVEAVEVEKIMKCRRQMKLRRNLVMPRLSHQMHSLGAKIWT